MLGDQKLGLILALRQGWPQGGSVLPCIRQQVIKFVMLLVFNSYDDGDGYIVFLMYVQENFDMLISLRECND